MDEKQQDNFRALLTEAIIKLCQMEAIYTNELRIEGTVCVVSDRASVMTAHFTEYVGNTQSLDSRNSRSECVFERHTADGLYVGHSELTLPEVKVEHVLSDEVIRTFEEVADVDSLSVMHGFCQANDRSLNANNDTAVDVKHSDGKQYKCPYCPKTYNLKCTLQRHIKTHHGRKLHRCHYCSSTFARLATLHMHIKREHGNSCDSEQGSKKLADKSSKQHHARPYCDFPLTTEQDDNIEQDSCLDTNIYILPDNDETTHSCLEADSTDSLALLEALERQDYQKMIDDTQLLVTDTNVTDDEAMRQLSESHKYGTPESLCSNSLKHRNASKATVMQYFEKVHVETSHGLYQYKCCLCHKMFKIRTSLYEHINSHTGNRPYACDQCGFRFAHHSSLHNHVYNKHMFASQEQHTWRYLCSGCERRFKFHSQFERHLRSHPDHSTKVLDVQ